MPRCVTTGRSDDFQQAIDFWEIDFWREKHRASSSSLLLSSLEFSDAKICEP